MKKMKKLASIALALVMTLALALPAFAAEGEGTITITNAAKGATYEFYQLFTATVNDADKKEGDPGIAYKGDIPAGLEAYFQKDSFGQVTAKEKPVDYDESVKSFDQARTEALKTWAEGRTPDRTVPNTDGGALTVTVPYGYYVIMSNVGGGSAITVDSTNPNASVTDKNTTTTPVWPADGKTVNGTVFEMGKTATYTVTLKTVNWVPGENTGDAAVKVTEYTISDDFADGALTGVNVTSIVIGNEVPITGEDAQFKNGTITLPWVDDAGESLHENGVDIVITYTATVSGTGKMENTVSATYKTDGDPIPVPNNPKADVYNSTIVVNKYTGDNKDDANKKLAGAKFTLSKTVVENDVPVTKYYKLDNNVVTWVDEANAQVFVTDSNGAVNITGLADGTYSLTETEAPAGYNKLMGSKEITVNAADGEHIVSYTADVQNNIGSELPSTGGIGTTIFTVVGGLLMVGAAVLFITKKRSAT